MSASLCVSSSRSAASAPPEHDQDPSRLSRPAGNEAQDASENDEDKAPLGSSVLATAIRIACEKGSDGLRWMIVRELQLSSKELCAACRQAAPFRVRVNGNTPRRLWAARSDSGDVSDGDGKTPAADTGAAAAAGSTDPDCSVVAVESMAGLWRWVMDLLGWGGRGDGGDSCSIGIGAVVTASAEPVEPAEPAAPTFSGISARGKLRVPPLRVVSVVWESSVKDMGYGDYLPPGLQDLDLYETFNERVQEVRWPATLKTLTFRRDFVQDVSGVVWPPALEELRFGFCFNHSLEGVVFPDCLRIISFGWDFNQCLDRVLFPPSLEEIAFGFKFCKSLDNVVFPNDLSKISFGESFDLSVDSVRWPQGLQSLAFGRRFNKSLEAVALPAGLRKLIFERNFDQPLEGVVWPAALEMIDLGGCSHSIRHVTWPAGLKRLTLGTRFDGSVGHLPGGLKHITLGRKFRKTSASRVTDIVWPVELETIVFRGGFNQPIADVLWPENLKTLTFSAQFNQSLRQVVWPPGLERLEFCRGFHSRFRDIVWPRNLKTLKFCSSLYRWDGQELPPGVDVEFGWGGHRHHELS